MNIAPTNSVAQAGDAGRHRDADDFSAAALAFEALLHGAQTAARADTLSQKRTSPAQMFEPAREDPGQARITELQAESKRETSGNTSGIQPLSTKQPAADSNPPAPVPSRDTLRPGGPMSSNIEPPPSPQDNGRPGPQPIASGAGNRPMEASPRNQAEPARMASAPISTSSSASLTPTAPVPDGGANVTLARQIGELLAAARPGGQHVSEGASLAPSSATDRPLAPQSPRKAEAKPPPEQTAQRPAGTAGSVEETPFARLVRSLRIGERMSSARLQLHPPALGRMRVDVRLAGDQLALEVRTETEAARDLIAQRAGELKLALEQHGIWIHRLDVTVQESRAAMPDRAEGSPEESKRARRGDDDQAQVSRGRAFAFARLDVQG